ncbi:MAG TPA: LURP-one-related family protein [Verrucomicrobiota bacterium]|nr:hypothetical protein [Verrucomicrobiales bacterium]HRI11852.1 LURP-one-related family protein [Verrucomicrobiota bacterium]
MIYVLKQRFWSLGNNFHIRDSAGRDVFQVNGRILSLGDKLSFQDLQGRELIFIRQKVLSWGLTYYLEREGQVIAEVRKHLFTFLKCKFTVDVPGPDDFEAQGNLLDHEYTITRRDRVAATISKRWFTWTDTYGVETADGEDDVLLLAAAVVIDLACHQENRSH